jgi:aminopeptidase N
MKWYDDLWLKEGFSTYLAYVGINAIKPEWDYFKTITMNEVHKAMPKDCDASSRPISFPVKTQSDIRRVFDPISYSKGALIINMMRGFLGENTFRSGLSNYLKKFSYSNAVQDDLWESMEDVAKIDDVLNDTLTVKQIMDSWTNHAGFPVVSVKRSGSNVIISQQRYFLPYTNHSDTTRWYVPISYSTSSRQPEDEIPEYWLTRDVDEVTIEDAVGEDEWIFININRTGYYRVNYDQLSWKNLIKNFVKHSDITRAMLVDDAFNLARANLTDYDIPITMGIVIRNAASEDYLSWWAFESGIEYLNNMLKREEAYGSFRTVMKHIVQIPFDSYNFEEFEDESDVEILHRQRIVDLACEYGIEKCTQTAQLIFREWITNKVENK